MELATSSDEELQLRRYCSSAQVVVSAKKVRQNLDYLVWFGVFKRYDKVQVDLLTKSRQNYYI